MERTMSRRVRIILFLSRFAFICNIAFLLFVFFRWLESRQPVKETGDRVVELPFIKEVIIILGFSAIIINSIILIIYLIYAISGIIKQFPRWLIIANILFFLLQIYYFFLF